MLTTTRRARLVGLVLSVLAALTVTLVSPATPARAAAPDPVVCSQGRSVTEPLHLSTSPVASCTFAAPTAGTLVIVASASLLPTSAGSASARASLGVDGVEVPRTGQYAGVVANAGDGADANSGPVTMTRVQAGTHSADLLISKQDENPVIVTRSSIWALFVPDGSPYQTCASIPDSFDGSASAGNLNQDVASCTLTTTAASRLVVLGSGSYAAWNGAYEARTGISVDGAAPDGSANRWSNTYATDLRHAPIATQLVQDVQPGAHTVTLQTGRSSGTGALRIFRPNLVALAVPIASTGIQVCSAVSSAWQSTSAPQSSITTCSLTASTAGDLLALGTGSAGLGTAAFEGEFSMNVDGGATPVGATRWLDVATDSGDGQDATQASSAAFAVQPGVHTVTHTGALSSGSGPARLFRASLVGIFVPTPGPWSPPPTTPPTPGPTTLTTTPVPTPTPPAPAPAPEATLVGSKVKVAATVRLTKGATGCPAKATVRVVKGRTKLATAKLRAKAAGRSACRVSGRVALPSKPSASTRLTLTISGKGVRTRTVKVARG